MQKASGFHKNILLSILILCFSHNLLSQLIPLEYSHIVQSSDLIVYGVVVDQECFYDDALGLVTVNQVEIREKYVGETKSGHIEVLTLGGIIGNEQVTWSNVLSLNKNDEGVFHIHRNSDDYYYRVYAGKQGFLKKRLQPFGVIWSSPFKVVYDKKDLHESIAYCDDRLKSNQSLGLECLEATLEPVLYLPVTEKQSITINANLKLHSKFNPVFLYKNEFILSYDTMSVGSDILTSGTLDYTVAPWITNNPYNVSLSQVSADSILIKMELTGLPSQALSLGNTKENVLTLQLEVEDITDIIESDIQINVVPEKNWYYESTLTDSTKWECYEFENKFSYENCDEPIISDLNTYTAIAGKDEIIITGVNFGTPKTGEIKPNNMRVGFTNAGDPSNGNWCFPPIHDISLWTDTEIRVKIPARQEDGSEDTHAGSGPILIWNNNDTPNDSSDDCYGYSESLHIPCAQRTSQNLITSPQVGYESIPLILADVNGSGGYSLYYTDDFSNLNGATSAFRRARDTWSCATNVHWNIESYDDIVIKDNACKIDYRAGQLPQGTTASIAITSIIGSSCPGNDKSHSYMKKFDLIFNKYVLRNNSSTEINWWTSQTEMTESEDVFPNRDLETIALHELGHAHGLLHTNYGSIMDPKYESTNRELDDNKFCAINIVNLSIDENFNCVDEMTKLIPSGCSTYIGEETLNVIRAYPNPSTGELWVVGEYLKGKKLRLISSNGRLIQEHSLNGLTKLRIDFAEEPSGLYFVHIIGNSSHEVLKIIKLNR